MDNEIISKKTILKIAQEAVHAKVAEHLGSSYNSPLNSILSEVITEHRDELKKIFDIALREAFEHEHFKNAVHDAFNHKLAKVMVSKLEGSVEKAVDAMRQDQTLRAKMILAIEEIINAT